MPKATLMIFGTKNCSRNSKVSFQTLDTEIEDLESGLGKVAEEFEAGNIQHGDVFPLYGYVHVSQDSDDDEDWGISPIED